MAEQEFIDRVNEVMAQETLEPTRWMYLSFADEKFNGAVIIEANGLAHAITHCHSLGINPGGEVMGVDMPDEIIAQVPENMRTKLLSKEDVQSIWSDAKSLREFEAEDAAGSSLERV